MRKVFIAIAICQALACASFANAQDIVSIHRLHARNRTGFVDILHKNCVVVLTGTKWSEGSRRFRGKREVLR